MSTAQLSPKPASIVEAKTMLSVLKNVRNAQRSKKETDNDTDYILF